MPADKPYCATEQETLVISETIEYYSVPADQTHYTTEEEIQVISETTEY